MPQLVPAIFGITNDGLNLAVSLLLLFLIVIWLALVYWTFADARRRIADPLLVGCATMAALFPFVGSIVYMIVRPPEYLDDVRERELEMQAAEARLAEAGFEACPHCGESVERDYLRCPSCLRKLKDPCPRCSRPLRPGWQVCPYCELELAEPVGSRRSRRSAQQAPAEPSSRRRRRSEAAAVAAEPQRAPSGRASRSQRQRPDARSAVPRPSTPGAGARGPADPTVPPERQA